MPNNAIGGGNDCKWSKILISNKMLWYKWNQGICGNHNTSDFITIGEKDYYYLFMLLSFWSEATHSVWSIVFGHKEGKYQNYMLFWHCWKKWQLNEVLPVPVFWQNPPLLGYKETIFCSSPHDKLGRHLYGFVCYTGK